MDNRQQFIIAVIIITTICVLLLGIVANTIINKTQLTESAKQIVGNLVSALIALVGVILGNKTLNK